LSERGLRWACLSYRWLLVLLPGQVRDRDGQVMLELFRRLAAEARVLGAPSLVSVWFRSAGDLLVHAWRERWRHARRGRAEAKAAGGDLFRKGRMLDDLRFEVRHAIRSLRRRPGFSALAGVTFALGIGATTAMFGVVDAVLIRDLPYQSPDRIVRLMGTRSDDVNFQGTLAYLNVHDVFATATSFEVGAAYDEWQPNLTGNGEPERLTAAQVNVDFFRVFGVKPAVGRFFVSEEDTDGRDRVVVLSWALWQRRFGGDPAIVGRAITLNGNPHVVVGVAPRDFEDPELSGPSWGTPVLWRPLGYDGVPAEQQPSRSSSSFVAVARLKPGVTLERARSELAALSHGLEEQFPKDNENVGMTALSLRDAIIGDAGASLLLLLGAVALVLAIAAANVGNLLLSRATEQRHEMALRISIGASRRRVIGQAITETLVLAFAGAIGGIGLALAATRSITGLAGGFIPRDVVVGVNLPVLAFAALVTIAAGLVCSAAPALVAIHSDPRASLGEAGRGSTTGRRSGRLRRGLVTAETALAFLLLVGAGLVGRSLWNLMSVDIGIDPASLLTFQIALPASSYPDDDGAVRFYDQLLSRIQDLPGVRAAAVVNIVPLSGSFDSNTVTTPERPDPPADQRVSPQTRTVSPSYFATAGITLRDGRFLDDRDLFDAPRVVVITESLEHVLWPGENAVGKRLNLRGTVAEVVGVVGNVKHTRIEEPSPPLLYSALAQRLYPWHTRRLTVLVRTAGDPIALTPAVRRVVAALDPLLPLASVRTMDQIVARAAGAPRFRTALLTAFATLALLLAAIGIYGVVSCSVSGRSRELAIRSALGARAASLVRLVLEEGLVPVALGLAVGSLAAFALSRVLAAVLFDVTTTDLAVFTAVPACLFLVALLATLAPARRATRADPMSVLRET
jgi:putative ABC transport system permease protein